MALNDTLDQMDLTDTYRTFHPKEAKYAFFSNAHGTLSKIDHMIGHKTSPNKFRKMEIISSIFLDLRGLKLETNFMEKIKAESGGGGGRGVQLGWGGGMERKGTQL